ncbi:MAG: UDP-N-acetylglucosamine 2-epimerase (non-hydrolyzing) [Flavobacteriales bacterium]|nr:UDP-N-acetylglucosamine 2-epimerase (non-hydrolyzing) [Flavobacteriales bacterium]
MKIVTIIGARPQFIKAAVVSKMFIRKGIDEILVHTGQHFDKNMSDIFFDEMGIPKPSYNLNISGLSHGAMTGQMLEKVEEILLKEKPDFTLVYGDTNSTLAGALASSKIHIPIIHIEAGLRSFNMRMPEEINRILTDRISSILFCPTQTAISNLKKEGFENFQARMVQSGDVMEDSALMFEKVARNRSNILDILNLRTDQYVLATIHRAENTDNDQNLKALFAGLDEINKLTPVILPLHPRTSARVNQLNIHTSVQIIEPVGYLDMTMLTSNSKLVVTDSGGLQKEAFFFNRFCITLREETEWVELVDNGYNFLAGSHKTKVSKIFMEIKGKTFKKAHNFYGGGTASEFIANYLLENYG